MTMSTLIKDRDALLLGEGSSIDLEGLKERFAAIERPAIDLSRLDPRRLDLSAIDLSQLELPPELPGPLGRGSRRRRARRRRLLGVAGLLAAAIVVALVPAVRERFRAWKDRFAAGDARPDVDGRPDVPGGPDAREAPDPTGERTPAWAPVMAESAAGDRPARSPWDPIAPTTPDAIDAARAGIDDPERADDPSRAEVAS